MSGQHHWPSISEWIDAALEEGVCRLRRQGFRCYTVVDSILLEAVVFEERLDLPGSLRGIVIPRVCQLHGPYWIDLVA